MSTDHYWEIVYELRKVTKRILLLEFILDILFFFTCPSFIDTLSKTDAFLAVMGLKLDFPGTYAYKRITGRTKPYLLSLWFSIKATQLYAQPGGPWS